MTNLESLLTPSLLHRYSFLCLLLSTVCIGVDSISLILFFLNNSFDPLVGMNPNYISAVRLNGQGIWCGILGVVLSFLCNDLAINKSREACATDADFFAKIQDKILHLEAGLFACSIVVSIISFCGVLMSGYTCLEILALGLTNSKVEKMVLTLYIIETICILLICLTVFTLAIYSFNIILPLYFSSVFSSCFFKCFASKKEVWKSSPTCEFSHNSFSGSSVQFGTIQTLSEGSFSAILTRKLGEKRINENYCKEPQSIIPQNPSGSNLRSSNRSDLILF